MPRKSKVSSLSFEPLRKNPLSLRDDESLGSDLKIFKIGGENIPLSLSKEEFRISSNLFLEGKLSNPLLSIDYDYVEINPKVYTRFTSSDYTGSLDIYVASGDTYMVTSSDDFYFLGQGDDTGGIFSWGYIGNISLFKFDSHNTKFLMADDSDTGDTFAIQIAEHAATTITTTDDDAQAGHLRIWPDGDLKLTPKTGIMYLYDSDNADDYAKFTVGPNGVLVIETVDAAATAAHLTLQPDGDLKLTPAGFNTLVTIDDSDESQGAFQVAINGATNRAFSLWGEDGAFTELRMYEMGGASTTDYFTISVAEHGATTLSTLDSAATAANLTLDIDGDIELNADGGDVTFKDASAYIAQIRNATTSMFEVFDINSADSFIRIAPGGRGDTTISTTDGSGNNVAHLRFEPDGSFLIKEVASAGADVAAYGQIWVKNSTPNELYFTTDAGDDIQLTSGTSTAGGGGGTQYWNQMLPGYVTNKTSTTLYYTFLEVGLKVGLTLIQVQLQYLILTLILVFLLHQEQVL